MSEQGTEKPDGYYDPESPNYWKVAHAKRGHTRMVERIWAPGDIYHVCMTCSQQVNLMGDGIIDCDAAVLIRENGRLTSINTDQAARIAELTALVDDLLGYAEDYQDMGPEDERWKSDELLATIERARTALARDGSQESAALEPTPCPQCHTTMRAVHEDYGGVCVICWHRNNGELPPRIMLKIEGIDPDAS